MAEFTRYSAVHGVEVIGVSPVQWALEWMFFAVPQSWTNVIGRRVLEDFAPMQCAGYLFRMAGLMLTSTCMCQLSLLPLSLVAMICIAVNMVDKGEGGCEAGRQMKWYLFFAVVAGVLGAYCMAGMLLGLVILKLTSTHMMMLWLYGRFMVKLRAINGEAVPQRAMARTPILLDEDAKGRNLCMWQLLFREPERMQARLANRSDGKMDVEMINFLVAADIVAVWYGGRAERPSVCRVMARGRAIDVTVYWDEGDLHAKIGCAPELAEQVRVDEVNRVFRAGPVGYSVALLPTAVGLGEVESFSPVSALQQRRYMSSPYTKRNRYWKDLCYRENQYYLLVAALVFGAMEWMNFGPGSWIDKHIIAAQKASEGPDPFERKKNQCGWAAIFSDPVTSQHLLCDRRDGRMSELTVCRLIDLGEVRVYIEDGLIINATAPRYGAPRVYVDTSGHMSNVVPEHVMGITSAVVKYNLGSVGTVLPMGRARRRDTCDELEVLVADCIVLRRTVDASNPKLAGREISEAVAKAGRVAECCWIYGQQEIDYYRALWNRPAMSDLVVADIGRWYLSQKGWSVYSTRSLYWLRGSGDTRRVVEPDPSHLAWDGYKFIMVEWFGVRPRRAYYHDIAAMDGRGVAMASLPPYLLYMEGFIVRIGRAYVTAGLRVQGGLEHECDRVLIEGVPSCGKSTEIMNTAGPNDLVTLPSRSGAKEYARRLMTVQTLDSIVKNGLRGMDRVDTLFVDEGLLAHCGSVDLVAEIVRPSKIRIFGDRRQVEFVCRVGGYEMVHDWSTYPWSSTPEPRIQAWKNPIVVCDLLRPFYPDGYVNMSGVKGSLSRSQYYSPESVPGGYDVYLTYTQSDRDVIRKELKYYAMTIHEAQGLRFERVCLVRMKPNAISIYDKLSYNIVAVSRASLDFHYCTVKPTDFMSMWIKTGVGKVTGRLAEGEFVNPEYYQYGGGYTVVVDRVTHLAVHEPSIGYDAWCNIIAHVMPVSPVRSLAFIMRHVLVKSGAKVPRHGRIFPAMPEVSILQAVNDGLFRPLNRDISRGDRLVWPAKFEGGIRFDMNKSSRTPQLLPRIAIHPKLRTTQYDRANRHTLDIVTGLSKRVIAAPQSKLDYAPERAAKLVDGFMRQVNQARLDVINVSLPIDGEEVRIHWFNTRGTRKQAIFTDCRPELISGNKYYIIIRGDHKPKLDNGHEDTVPAGQLVTAHHPFWTSIFAPMFGVLTIKIMAVLNPNIMMNTRMTWEQLSGHVDSLISGKRFKVLELDIAKYDKSQDETMLEAECRVMLKFGMPVWAVDLWRVFHALAALADPHFGLRFTVGYQRRSGDAATWIGNTMCLIMIMAYLYPIEDSHCCVVGGDDNLTMFKHEYQIPDVAGKAAEELNFELKTICPHKSMYFSSRLLILLDSGWKFVADPVKIVQRLGRTDLQGYEHLQAIWESWMHQHYDYFDNQTRHALHEATCAHYTFQLQKPVTDVMPFINAVAAMLVDIKNFHRLYTGTSEEWGLSLDPTERIGGSGLYDTVAWMYTDD